MKMITGARLIRGNGEVSEGALLVEGDRIVDITEAAPASLLLNRENIEVFSGEGCFLTPGLIDQHFHGGFGTEFNQGNISEINHLMERLPAFGVTASVPTVMTAPTMDMLTAVNTVEEVIHLAKPDQCRVLGIHLEGPFLNPDYRGAHPAADLQSQSIDELQMLISPNLRIMTLAPELDPQGEMIRYLSERGVNVSAGHSGATFDQMQKAVDQGVRCVTHLFNAMCPFHHREPGVVGATLNEDRLYAEVIADGVHLHPETVRTIVRAKNPERLILISDCLALAGMGEGESVTFGNQQVTNRQGKAINAEGHLAGSTVFLNECFKNLVKWKILPIQKAILLASTNPARFLGVDNQLGKLEPGYLADMVLWDARTLEVKATWIGGELVYSHTSMPSVSRASLSGT